MNKSFNASNTFHTKLLNAIRLLIIQKVEDSG
jgi:hypothetical protein